MLANLLPNNLSHYGPPALSPPCTIAFDFISHVLQRNSNATRPPTPACLKLHPLCTRTETLCQALLRTQRGRRAIGRAQSYVVNQPQSSQAGLCWSSHNAHCPGVHQQRARDFAAKSCFARCEAARPWDVHRATSCDAPSLHNRLARQI